MEKFYVTTPIYYVNGAPHIGHAYTTIVADALARFHRLRGSEVFFLTGTDEHGLKIQRAAEAQGLAPKDLADKNSAEFRRLFEKLELTYDRFIRTTDADHRETVEWMVKRLLDSGDVYLGEYEGWYSASDEAYYDESEIEDGVAIASGSPVEWVKEKTYFFRLSAFGDRLLKWYEDHPDCIAPSARRNEVSSFVAGGLHDLSISRTTFEWGIPMPSDPEHVLYVWVDALTNYYTAVGPFAATGDPDTREGFWPADIHIIGKDILRFHAVYWPAFLMSAKLPLPKQIFAHGWWLNEGEKMSKSKGNFIDAFDLSDEYDLDVLRYYMLREIPPGNDGNFSKTRVVERNNAELADNIGNLVNRALTMHERYVGGEIPACPEVNDAEDIKLRDKAIETVAVVEQAVQNLELHRALEAITSLSSETNNYIQTVQPWALQKADNMERLNETLYCALEAIRFVAVLLSAFVPDASAKILDGLLGQSEAGRDLPSLRSWGGLPAGQKTTKPDVLFQKLEPPVEEEADKEQEVTETEAPQEDNLVSFDHVMSVELRVGEILTAQPVDGADRLLKLTANVGEDDPRTIVAGIAKSFSPDELVGLRVAMVTNLQPAKLFGIQSQAMILAAKKPDGKLALARYSEDVPAGTPIS